jgi:hypothetical protein
MWNLITYIIIFFFFKLKTDYKVTEMKYIFFKNRKNMQNIFFKEISNPILEKKIFFDFFVFKLGALNQEFGTLSVKTVIVGLLRSVFYVIPFTLGLLGNLIVRFIDFGLEKNLNIWNVQNQEFKMAAKI